jgi:hypothetical protein
LLAARAGRGKCDEGATGSSFIGTENTGSASAPNRIGAVGVAVERSGIIDAPKSDDTSPRRGTNFSSAVSQHHGLNRKGM